MVSRSNGSQLGCCVLRYSRSRDGGTPMLTASGHCQGSRCLLARQRLVQGYRDRVEDPPAGSDEQEPNPVHSRGAVELIKVFQPGLSKNKGPPVRPWSSLSGKAFQSRFAIPSGQRQ